MREIREGDDTFYRRVGRRPGDALAAVLDAVGLARARRAPSSTPTATASTRPSTTTATAPGSTSSDRAAMPRGDGGGHACFAHHLGLEHMAFHGVQGRGVLVDLAHHLGHDCRAVKRATLEEIMAADDVVVEPGDMLLLHTGFATKVLEWNREPDPVEIHRMCACLDARDESLLEWIAESQISALVADNYAVEAMLGGGPLVDGKRTRCCRSTTSACSSSACRSARCGTCTSWRRGCASTTGAASCSPRRRSGSRASWARRSPRSRPSNCRRAPSTARRPGSRSPRRRR